MTKTAFFNGALSQRVSANISVAAFLRQGGMQRPLLCSLPALLQVDTEWWVLSSDLSFRGILTVVQASSHV